MAKHVAIGGKPRSTADDWVNHRDKEPPQVPMKRLTIDIPADLHRKFKTACADRDVRMADVLREMIADKYDDKEIR